MKIDNSREEFKTGGTAQTLDSMDYGLDESAKIFEILSKSIYSNKKRAIIRETATNALEGTREANSDRPFEVTLPTQLDPMLKFRDYGISMDHDTVKKVFAVYGKSTKADSSINVGGFGIGAKSPFSYTDIFHIKAYMGGVLRIYENSIQQSGKPRLELKIETETTEPDGIEVIIPVKKNDIYDFVSEAKIVLSAFKEEDRPVVTNMKDFYDECNNIVDIDVDAGFVPELKGLEKMNPTVVAGNPEIAVRMGCVIYPVRDDERVMEAINNSLFFEVTSRQTFILDVPVDTLKVRPTREDLEYDKTTVSYLLDVINRLNKSVRKNIVSIIREARQKKKFNEAVTHASKELNSRYNYNLADAITDFDQHSYSNRQMKSALANANLSLPVKFPLRVQGKTVWLTSRKVAHYLFEQYEDEYQTKYYTDENDKRQVRQPEIWLPLKFITGQGSSQNVTKVGDFPSFEKEQVTIYTYKTGCLKRIQAAWNLMKRHNYKVYFLKKMSDTDTQKVKDKLVSIYGSENINFEEIPDQVMNISFTDDSGKSVVEYSSHWINNDDYGSPRISRDVDRNYTNLDQVYEMAKNKDDKVVYCEMSWVHDMGQRLYYKFNGFSRTMIDLVSSRRVICLQKPLLKNIKEDSRFIHVEDAVSEMLKKLERSALKLESGNFIKSERLDDIVLDQRSEKSFDYDAKDLNIASKVIPKLEKLNESTMQRLFPVIDFSKKEFDDIDNASTIMSLMTIYDANNFRRRNQSSITNCKFIKNIVAKMSNIRQHVYSVANEALEMRLNMNRRFKQLMISKPLLELVFAGVQQELMYGNDEKMETVKNELEHYIFKRRI